MGHQLKRFSIVQFLEDESIGLVPSIWIFDNGKKCHWPSKPGIDVSSLVKRCIQPEKGNNWTSHALKCVLGGSDDYLKARQKTKLAENDSDLESSSKEVKRKRRATGRLRYFTNPKQVSLREVSSPEVSDHDNGTNKPPNANTFEVIDAPAGSFFEVTPESANSGIQEYELQLSQQQSEEIEGQGDSIPIRIVELPQSNVCTSCVELHRKLDLILTEFKGFKRATLKELGIIREDIQSMRHTQTSQSLPDQIQVLPNKLVTPKLPLSTIETFDEFNTWLTAEENYNFMVVLFGTKGGKTFSDITRKCLKSIFNKELASKYNFTGRNSKNVFSGLPVHDLVKDAVRKHENCKLITESEINAAIKDFFRFAPSRLTVKKPVAPLTENV